MITEVYIVLMAHRVYRVTFPCRLYLKLKYTFLYVYMLQSSRVEGSRVPAREGPWPVRSLTGVVHPAAYASGS